MRRDPNSRILQAGILVMLGSARLAAQPAGAPMPMASSAVPAGDPMAATWSPARRADGVADAAALAVLGVAINGREQAGDVIVAVRNGATLIPADAARQWRLPFAGPTIDLDGQAFVPLSAVPGLVYHVDEALQQLQLSVPIASFARSELLGERAVPEPSPAARTAFVNYDISLQHGGGRTNAAAFLETGASDARGLIENTMVLANNRDGANVIRLDSFALHDNPGGLTRLTIGDAFTAPGSWGSPIRFGGIKWGTDFSVQPGFLSFPTPTFDGEAAVPSNVQLYVNDVLNFQGKVDQGPFALNRLPVVTGAGDVSVVVKDALGIERRITSRYYVSTRLLRPGLSRFSVEAGAARYNYGIRSFDYRQPFVGGSFARGLTSHLTVETRAEASGHVQGGGVALATVVGRIGEMGGAVAVSRGPQGEGHLYRIYAARASSHLSMSLSYQTQSRDFTQIGLLDYRARPLTTLQVTAGVNSRRWGSLTGAQSDLKLADNTRARVTSLNYNRQLGRIGYLGLFAIRSHATDGGTDDTVGATLSIPMGGRRGVFVQADTGGRSVELQQNIPDDEGWAYRLGLAQGDVDRQQADLTYRSRAADVSGSLSRINGAMAERILASGSLLLAGPSVIPTRRINESFAIVDIGRGQKGVRVYQENRPVATTDGGGIAVVTNLRAYEVNRISVSPTDMKIDATISNDTLLVVPRYLGGVSARFTVNTGHAGTLIVHLPSGEPLEPGLSLTYGDGSGNFYSGFDGEVFIDDIREGKVVIAKRESGACRVIVLSVPRDVVLPRIGPLTCSSLGGAQ